MAEDDTSSRAKQVLALFSVILILFGVAMLVFGELLVAGITFLGVTFVIYLRETW